MIKHHEQGNLQRKDLIRSWFQKDKVHNSITKPYQKESQELTTSDTAVAKEDTENVIGLFKSKGPPPLTQIIKHSNTTPSFPQKVLQTGE